MKGSDNIEKIFKETFERFEADVNPKVWTNVQHSIQSVPGGTASSAAKFAAGKILAAAVGIAAVAGSIWYFSSSAARTESAPDKKTNTEITANETTQDNTPGNSVNRLSNSHANEQTASVNGPAPVTAENVLVPDQTGNSPEEAAENPAAQDNAAEAPVQHKYGNSPKGPSGIIRGANDPANAASKPKPANANAEPAETQIAEPAPTAIIYVASASGDAPFTLTFVNTGTAGALSWDFADGTSSKENYPTHTFTKPGTYEVELTVKNSTGTASDKVAIEVRSLSSIGEIANVFSPNGDNLYDYFSFEMKNIRSLEVTIADMTGHLVYSWTDLEGKWDGKLANGADAPDAVYIYSIRAIGIDGMVYTPKGTVTLKR